MQQAHLLIVFNTTGQHKLLSDPWAQIGINLASYVGQQIYVAFTYARDVTGATFIKVI